MQRPVEYHEPKQRKMDLAQNKLQDMFQCFHLMDFINDIPFYYLSQVKIIKKLNKRLDKKE